MLLAGCVKTNNDYPRKIQFPMIPIAGEKVANELERVCVKDKCTNLTMWLNDMYIFTIKYNIYRNEFAK
jgi:hypothetical protein